MQERLFECDKRPRQQEDITHEERDRLKKLRGVRGRADSLVAGTSGIDIGGHRLPRGNSERRAGVVASIVSFLGVTWQSCVYLIQRSRCNAQRREESSDAHTSLVLSSSVGSRAPI